MSLRAIFLATAGIAICLWSAIELRSRRNYHIDSLEISAAQTANESLGVTGRKGEVILESHSVTLYISVALKSSAARDERGVWIRLLRQQAFNNLEGGGGFVFYENATTPQKLDFGDGEIVRLFWMSENVNLTRTTIHVAAIHYRLSKVVGVVTDKIDIVKSAQE